MPRIIILPNVIGALAATCLCMSGAYAQSMSTDCEVDRAGMLKLSQRKFDQDMKGGWRALADKSGCELAAADLIRDYRQARGLEAALLYFHEGQLRATAGQYEQAAALVARSYETAEDSPGWNEYVDATVAFLRKDRNAFDNAWRRLAAIPPAMGMKDGYLEIKRNDGGIDKLRWPPNIDVVEGLAACFDKPYKEAASSACRRPKT